MGLKINSPVSCETLPDREKMSLSDGSPLQNRSRLTKQSLLVEIAPFQIECEKQKFRLKVDFTIWQ